MTETTPLPASETRVSATEAEPPPAKAPAKSSGLLRSSMIAALRDSESIA